MAHYGHLIAFRQFGFFSPQQILRQFTESVTVFVLWQGVTLTSWFREFENQVSIKSVVHASSVWVISMIESTRSSISSGVRCSVTANMRVWSSILTPAM